MHAYRNYGKTTPRTASLYGQHYTCIEMTFICGYMYLWGLSVAQYNTICINYIRVDEQAKKGLLKKRKVPLVAQRAAVENPWSMVWICLVVYSMPLWWQ